MGQHIRRRDMKYYIKATHNETGRCEIMVGNVFTNKKKAQEFCDKMMAMLSKITLEVVK